MVLCKIVMIVLSFNYQVYGEHNTEMQLMITVNHIKLHTGLDRENRLHTATYYYGEDDVVKTACMDLALEGDPLQVQFHYANTQHETSKPSDWSRVSPGSILYHTRMRTTHNNSYLICKSSKHNVKVTFILQKEFYGFINLSINNLPVRLMRSKNWNPEFILIFSHSLKGITFEYEATFGDIILHSPSINVSCGVEVKAKKISSVMRNVDQRRIVCAHRYINDYYLRDRVAITFRTISRGSFDKLPYISVKSLPNSLVSEKYDQATHFISYDYEENYRFLMNCSIIPVEIHKNKNFHLNFNGSDSTSKDITKTIILHSEDHLKELTCRFCDLNCSTVLSETRILLRDKKRLNVITKITSFSDSPHEDSNSSRHDSDVMQHSNTNKHFITIIILPMAVFMVFLVIVVTYCCCKRYKTIAVSENVYEDMNSLENVPPAMGVSNTAVEESEMSPPEYNYAYEAEIIAIEPRRPCPRHGEHELQSERDASTSLEYDYVYDGMLRP